MKLCKNGHNLARVGVYVHQSEGRGTATAECKQCKRNRNAARKSGDTPAGLKPRERSLKAVDVERAMDLRDRAKWLAAPWEREGMLAEADAIGGAGTAKATADYSPDYSGGRRG